MNEFSELQQLPDLGGKFFFGRYLFLFPGIHVFLFIYLSMKFCLNPVQQDENLIFTVQKRNIYIIIIIICIVSIIRKDAKSTFFQN